MNPAMMRRPMTTRIQNGARLQKAVCAGCCNGPGLIMRRDLPNPRPKSSQNEDLDRGKHIASNCGMKKTSQSKLAAEMLSFLEQTPLTQDLQWTKDWDFLYHFEAERQIIMREMIAAQGLHPGSAFSILDFGFLHGLTQEFLHRGFPSAQITVCDLPSSPIFQDREYMAAIGKRGYLQLLPMNINEVASLKDKYDVIVLGEVIEHFDPTQTARALENLKRVAAPGCLLIVTTPNAAGLYNCWMTLRQKDVIQSAPIPDKTFGYGHIHLWSPKLLRETAEHFGWQYQDTRFYHGREAEKFEEIRESWVSLGAQLNIRLLKFLGNRFPNLRGFFIAAFTSKG
jgi:2-polyprenyl-3-methyl-5-hydroxy-6-metoxy-1,4-benzoquinol methylase